LIEELSWQNPDVILIVVVVLVVVVVVCGPPVNPDKAFETSQPVCGGEVQRNAINKEQAEAQARQRYQPQGAISSSSLLNASQKCCSLDRLQLSEKWHELAFSEN
jgi:hypothetical protein